MTRAASRIGKNGTPVGKPNRGPKSAILRNGDPPLCEREEWTSFRTLDGLCRKAGASRGELAEVVVKELVDNALDVAGDCELDLSEGAVTVLDRGPGIPGDDEAIARLFSIARPMASSKYWRLPTRGALGNGLRVAVGAVLATGGKLLVSTRGRTLEIIPDALTGWSRAVRVEDYDGQGTRIEVALGRPLELMPGDLLKSEVAIAAARSWDRRYGGRSSPHWYDLDTFHELLRSAPEGMTVREFVAQFDGCSAAAGKIADGFAGRSARDLDRIEARAILSRTQGATKPVNPGRLGTIGEFAFSGAYYRKADTVRLPAGADGSPILMPVVVEAWADTWDDDSDAVFMVNGTPCVADAGAWYEAKEKVTTVYGPRFRLDVKTGKTGMLIHINIITPFMPVTSDGKEPDLFPFKDHIVEVLERAVKRARKRQPAAEEEKVNFITACFAHMEEHIRAVSDDRRYRFNWRQVFYRIRMLVEADVGKPLDWNYFNQDIVAAWEEEHGEESQAYRDPRGTFYVPHAGESFPLGTLQVEQFRRPEWKFNKVLFIEKEGFFEALKADGWPERHDCALMTSKGQSTQAARDLIDLIGETGEPVQVFCTHDADAAGTLIFQALDGATRQNITIINLGLDPWEAKRLADEGRVEIEDVSYKKRQAAGEYVGEDWADWLQTHRVELNAFTTPEFIEWLDGKMAEHGAGKVIPPASVMAEKLAEEHQRRTRESEIARVLTEAKIDDLVEAKCAPFRQRIEKLAEDLPERVAGELAADPQRHWEDVIGEMAETLGEKPDKSDS